MTKGAFGPGHDGTLTSRACPASETCEFDPVGRRSFDGAPVDASACSEPVVDHCLVASLRPVTQRPLHGHLMVEQPEAFFDELREAGLDIVSFHLEAVPEPGPSIAKARGAGLGVGLTMNLETPVEAVLPYLDGIDDVMLMSIRPGWSFQTLNEEVYPRLEAVRTDPSLRERLYAGIAGRAHPREMSGVA